MVDLIDSRLQTQFRDTVHIKAQQEVSRNFPWVELIDMTGDDLAYDSFGQGESQEANERNPVIQHTEQAWERRKLTRDRFYISYIVDTKDVLGMVSDPKGTLAESIAKELMRRKDRVIYNALFADVLVGRNFDTTVTYANDGGLVVDATAGLDYAKMLEIKQNFINNEVGNDMNKPMFMGITGKEHTSLMNINQLTSGDFIRTQPVDDGSMEFALGMGLIKFAGSTSGNTVANPIISEVSTERFGYAVAQGAVAFGISQDMNITIKDRPDLLNSTQITGELIVGAVRTEGKTVQQVKTTI